MKGLLTEDVIVARIEQKCDIKRDPTYDHQYKLDFIVDRFKSIAKLIPIGVQITTRLNDVPKQRVFLLERRKKTLVDRSIYVEVHPDVDINNWGAELIYNALVSFTFKNSLKKIDVSGVRINADITYDFFSLEDSIRQTHSAIHGKIFKYFPERKYGFIETKDKGQWYFNNDGITDSNLIENFLPNIQLNSDNNRLVRAIFVDFDDAGYESNDKSVPKAINIKLAKGKE